MTNEERAFIETDYACAYCGVKGFENLSIDHIEGRNGHYYKKYDNLIVLCHNCHHRKTTNKGIDLDKIKKLKKNLIIKTLTQYGVNALKFAVRNKQGVVANVILLSHLVELGFFRKGEVAMSYGPLEGNNLGEDVLFLITEEGKRIFNKWLN